MAWNEKEICAEPVFDCTIKEYLIEVSKAGNKDPDLTVSKIPDWVKNTALWYGQGKITEDEFLNTIKYLINQGIIKVK